jgi:hypothetical protein
MASNGPDPRDFLDMAQRMLRELFSEQRSDDDHVRDEPWAEATRPSSQSRYRHREPSSEQQRENLTFALATRAVEALEDLALNVAAIRQRLERTDPRASDGDEANS